MVLPQNQVDRLMTIYLTLSQYPILSTRIRKRMLQELFDNGIITPQAFEEEVNSLAVQSQEREGLREPYHEEPPEIWDLRLSRIRTQLTDLLYSQRFSFEMFENIVSEMLSERGVNTHDMALSLNPELAPLELVFEQAMALEKMAREGKGEFSARLQESKVVLIRNLISDQLRYINVAKEWFTIQDLAKIRQCKSSPGRIGGKAAGMLLAHRILMESLPPSDTVCIRTPESYFIGADQMYKFMAINNLVKWNDQKYKTEEEMRAEFPQIVHEFEMGRFPPDFIQRIQTILATIGKSPLIVRSSSLLEDNFGTSFAGKYESIFCPNQGTPKQNLETLTRAIARIYASTLNPNALLYRRSKGLQDYDERMALLIQVVEGEVCGTNFLPHAAGVAFSRNLYRWAPQIRREDGFVRLVWGLGTRAVDRVGNDYPRLIALSHPLLRPSNNPQAVRRYSQQYVDLIDLKTNEWTTKKVADVLTWRYPPLRYLAQVEEDGYFSSLRSSVVEECDSNRLVLTFDELLRRTQFASRMRDILHTLEEVYRAPVDLEFTLHIDNPESGKPKLTITLLQCRPQAQLLSQEKAVLPKDLAEQDIIFSTHFVVPEGVIDNVEYVVFVPAEGYFALKSENLRSELARLIGKLNAALKGKNFICVGPGRWGSSNADLGVPIDYGDIYNSRALVELAGQNMSLPPEPSLGTHFFQDLLEAQIYPLAISLDDPQNWIRHEFFYDAPDCAAEMVTVSEDLKDALRVIRVRDYAPEARLRIMMSDDKGEATAFLQRE